MLVKHPNMGAEMRIAIKCLLGSMVIFSSVAFAAPISLKGLDWSMDYSDMINQLNSDGYQCVGETNSLFKKGTPEGDSIRAYLCTKESAQVRISSTEIRFNCSAFDMCQHPADDVAQRLVNTGKVGELSPSMNQDEMMSIIDPTNSIYTEWCGVGDDGDGVCVNGNPRDGNLRYVILKKGSLGKSLSFD